MVSGLPSDTTAEGKFGRVRQGAHCPPEVGRGQPPNLSTVAEFGVDMAYSFTERKRIRKSFAKRLNNHQVPYLLTTQLESYAKFLQAEKNKNSRLNEGLQAAFSSIFPIVSNNGFARMEYVNYELSSPPFDVKECQQR